MVLTQVSLTVLKALHAYYEDGCALKVRCGFI